MALIDKRRRSGQLLEPVTPQMVTLTALPANRAPFKVVRSAPEQEDETMSKPTVTRRRRIKRMDAALISLLLPDHTTQERANEIMDTYALDGDFEFMVNEDGECMLVRRGVDIDKFDQFAHIPLGHGMVALLNPSVFEAARGDGEGISLARLEFDGRNAAEVKDWLKAKEIDFQKDGVEVVEGGVIVTRHDIDDQELVKIVIEKGVTGFVSRSDEDDVPIQIHRAVTDQAFGQYGMGHLDFASAMADPQFSNAADEAIWRLSDVMQNIMFFSQVQLSERKRLYRAAADQFVSFMDSLIDSLPEAVRLAAEAVARSDIRKRNGAGGNSNQETADMINFGSKARRADSKAKDDSTKTTPDTNEIKREDKAADKAAENDKGKDAAAQRTDEGAEAENTADKDEGINVDEKDESQFVTRGELAEAVTTAVQAALEPVHATRAEDQKSLDTRLDKLTSAMEATAGAVAGMTRAVEDMGSTVMRSDADEDDADENQPVNAKRKDIFDGAFGRIHGLR